MARYGLENAEMHTAWVLRPYREQSQIPGFVGMDWNARRAQVRRLRTAELLRLQQSPNRRAYRQAKKNYAHTEAYVHLTRPERREVVRTVADCISNWGFSRLFAECVDKIYFDPVRMRATVEEQSFEQVVSRFHQYLTNTETGQQTNYGLLVHDNNQSVAKKHTELMRHYHSRGTLWTSVDRIIETPLFVDSHLTRMVQMADLCAYALRRYVENGETDLFRRIFSRADRARNIVVGIRHFTDRVSCNCEICAAHTPAQSVIGQE